ncbi:PREDICTED: ankyrin repeat domain-containing protein 29-like [Amphimedon queenslandica]|nr:PREDICTED: ankyrin repeat domain-containing protein 29-like [Amphimedon queenslandica]|eukprot:XP_011409265.1 PREDICTED: ankyrin repeat domain-containing protein 29-like [Amphimedon queenslandica]
MLACREGHTQIVKLLLKENFDPNVKEENGQNAFMLACKNGQIQIVELLLEEQVHLDPNVQDKEGYTALMIASANGHKKIVKLLLDWLADPEIQANDGSTALTLAKTRDIADILNSSNNHACISDSLFSGGRSSHGG